MTYIRLRDVAHRISSGLLRWHYRRRGMAIGEGCLIARSAKLDKTHPRGIQIGDHTAIAFGAAVLTHDFVNDTVAVTRIGSNCFIGAHSLVMPGVEIGDQSVVGAGSVVYTDVPPNTVVAGNPARVVERGIRTGHFGMRVREEARDPAAEPVKGPRPEASSAVPDLLASYFPGRDLSVPLDELGIDSFSLVTLRAEIEERNGRLIPDEQWAEIETPADIAKLIEGGAVARAENSGNATVQRRYEINMPQMAKGGLSESWLFKEIGDMHWSMLASALGKRSSEITDENGERLYATFTRIRYESQIPLSAFRENDELILSSEMSRFGAGLFFSSVEARSQLGTMKMDVMSSFSRIQEPGNSRSLVKGQPAIPVDFAVPSASALPAMAQEYRSLRAAEPDTPIRTCDYQINPVHDINGVGLLYFASYPIIVETCLRRFWREEALWSPVARDCCYFANSGPDETLEFGLISFEVSGDRARAVCSLTRQDGTRMALVSTDFARVGATSSQPLQEHDRTGSTRERAEAELAA